jgi:hypothetical protein
MLNIKFSYLYRDAGNYKKWAEIIFRNPEGLLLELITKTLRDAFLQDGLFVAHQIRVPDAFLYSQENATSDDHCFHEFDAVELTAESPDDIYSRSISQFIDEANKQAKRGWIAFDPHGTPAEQISD